MNHAILGALLTLSLQTPAPTTSFEKSIERILAESNTVGCAIAYAEGDKLKYAKGFGYANLEHKVRMKPESVHELASVSKQFTAACILQLVEKGKLSLEDPLSKFFEEANGAWKTVTVRHLLHHTSGLPDYLSAIPGPFAQLTDKQLVDSIKDKPLKFEPGSKWEYSNSGYMLLGLIVARASGTAFGEYLKTNIFQPAGMTSAHYNDTRAIVPNRADGYSVRNGKLVREDFTSTSLSGTGDGQVMASALDLIAWDRALASGKVLSPTTQKLMSVPSEASRKGSPKGVRGYGFGVMVLDAGDKLVLQHNGGWMGTATSFFRYVDDRKCLVILCNSDRAPLRELVAACEERFLGKKSRSQ